MAGSFWNDEIDRQDFRSSGARIFRTFEHPARVLPEHLVAVTKASSSVGAPFAPSDLRSVPARTSVPAQHQRLDRKQQRLDPQQHRMHDAGGIDGMQHKALERAGVL